MKRRRLAPEDIDLWRRVADRTEKLHRSHGFDPDAYAPPVSPSEPTKRGKPAWPSSVFPPKPKPRTTGYDLAPSLPEKLRADPVQMDRKAFGKLKRGKLVPEGRIDLHGMTLDHAHPALARFILSAHGSGKRLVLVITGKGKNRDEGGPIPVRYGVLRHQVPHWLSMAPLASLVLQVTPAHVSHGGSGAYYVYLRRAR
jgi:DNA-nicking Smr family endonuclease